MICYFDTSAIVPLVVAEPSSALCQRLWNEADAVATTRMSYVEAAAALAQALRMHRLTHKDHGSALRILDRLWNEFEIVEVDEPLTRRAAELAHRCALRGYDAVQCASAAQLEDDDLVIAGGDRQLLEACATLGLAVADINH